MTTEAQVYFLETIVVGDLQINCYLFGCAETKETAIIDPGGDARRIEAAVDKTSADVRMILLTHGHYDHLGAVSELKKRYQCPILIHRLDEQCLTNPMVNLSALTGHSIVCPPADQLLDDGDTIELGRLQLAVMHTPGHTRGSVSFRYGNLVFSGDLLFRGSIGRTDLPGGSLAEIERSIAERVYVLPDDTVILPGHGEPTTVGYEKKFNPFVREVL